MIILVKWNDIIILDGAVAMDSAGANNLALETAQSLAPNCLHRQIREKTDERS